MILQKDAPVPAGVLHRMVTLHWKPVFVPQLGDGDLLVSGKSPESSILVTTLGVSACTEVKPPGWAVR